MYKYKIVGQPWRQNRRTEGGNPAVCWLIIINDILDPALLVRERAKGLLEPNYQEKKIKFLPLYIVWYIGALVCLFALLAVSLVLVVTEHEEFAHPSVYGPW